MIIRKRKETLCWTCNRVGTGGCSWDKKLEPVKGWKAKKTPYRGSKRPPDYTYLVTACPLYIYDGSPDAQQRMRCMTDADREKATELLLKGERVNVIARELDVAPNSVSYHKRKLIRQGVLQKQEKEN